MTDFKSNTLFDENEDSDINPFEEEEESTSKELPMGQRTCSQHVGLSRPPQINMIQSQPLHFRRIRSMQADVIQLPDVEERQELEEQFGQDQDLETMENNPQNDVVSPSFQPALQILQTRPKILTQSYIQKELELLNTPPTYITQQFYNVNQAERQSINQLQIPDEEVLSLALNSYSTAQAKTLAYIQSSSESSTSLGPQLYRRISAPMQQDFQKLKPQRTSLLAQKGIQPFQLEVSQYAEKFQHQPITNFSRLSYSISQNTEKDFEGDFFKDLPSLNAISMYQSQYQQTLSLQPSSQTKKDLIQIHTDEIVKIVEGYFRDQGVLELLQQNLDPICLSKSFAIDTNALLDIEESVEEKNKKNIGTLRKAILQRTFESLLFQENSIMRQNLDSPKFEPIQMLPMEQVIEPPKESEVNVDKGLYEEQIKNLKQDIEKQQEQIEQLQMQCETAELRVMIDYQNGLETNRKMIAFEKERQALEFEKMSQGKQIEELKKKIQDLENKLSSQELQWAEMLASLETNSSQQSEKINNYLKQIDLNNICLEQMSNLIKDKELILSKQREDFIEQSEGKDRLIDDQQTKWLEQLQRFEEMQIQYKIQETKLSELQQVNQNLQFQLNNTKELERTRRTQHQSQESQDDQTQTNIFRNGYLIDNNPGIEKKINDIEKQLDFFRAKVDELIVAKEQAKEQGDSHKIPMHKSFINQETQKPIIKKEQYFQDKKPNANQKYMQFLQDQRSKNGTRKIIPIPEQQFTLKSISTSHSNADTSRFQEREYTNRSPYQYMQHAKGVKEAIQKYKFNQNSPNNFENSQEKLEKRYIPKQFNSVYSQISPSLKLLQQRTQQKDLISSSSFHIPSNQRPQNQTFENQINQRKLNSKHSGFATPPQGKSNISSELFQQVVQPIPIDYYNHQNPLLKINNLIHIENKNNYFNLTTIDDKVKADIGGRFDQYNGEKVRGLRHGNGTQVYPDGSQYQGAWQNNKRDGYGTLIQGNVEIYSGRWKDDQKHGCGHLINTKVNQINHRTLINYKDLSNIQWISYHGDFFEDRFHGFGVQTYVNGERFNGLFKNGQPNGKGTYNFLDGEFLAGVWVNGIYQISI